MEYCSNCGHEIPGDNFCGNCGKKTKRKLPLKDYSKGREKGLSKIEIDKLGNTIILEDSTDKETKKNKKNKKKSKKDNSSKNNDKNKKSKEEKEDVTSTVAILVIIFSIIVAFSSVVINYVNYLSVDNMTAVISLLVFIFTVSLMIVKKYEKKDIFLISILAVVSFLAFILIINESIYELTAEEIIEKNKIYLIRVCPLIISLNFIDVKGIKNQTLNTSFIKVLAIGLMLILISVPFMLMTYAEEGKEDILVNLSIMSFLDLGSIVSTLIVSLVGTLYIISIGKRTIKEKNSMFIYGTILTLVVWTVLSVIKANSIESNMIAAELTKRSPVFLLSSFAVLPFIVVTLCFSLFEESNE